MGCRLIPFGVGTLNSSSQKQIVLKIYVYAVISLGIAFLVLVPPSIDLLHWSGYIVLILFTLVAEAYPISLPGSDRGTVSVSFAPLFAILLLFGPGAAAWAGAVGTIRKREILGKVALEKVLFNRVQLGLAMGLGSFVYIALGGIPGTIDIVAQLGPMIMAGLVVSVVNIGTVTFALALVEGKSFWQIWFYNFKWMTPHFLALIPLGIIFASVQLAVGTAGTLMFAAPLVIARYSFKLYMDMREVHLSTMRALISAIEARDPYTSGHSARVTRYAVNTARAMNLRDDFCEKLTLVCLLHDIGKIGVPDSILLNRGILNDEEFSIIAEHPRIGARIVSQIESMGEDVAAILHHHERYDGDGYPDGLAEKDIPLSSRILAVADTFDAMTSRRPYRDAVSCEEAVAELIRCSGGQFDPDVVKAFLKANESIAEDDHSDILEIQLRAEQEEQESS